MEMTPHHPGANANLQRRLQGKVQHLMHRQLLLQQKTVHQNEQAAMCHLVHALVVHPAVGVTVRARAVAHQAVREVEVESSA